MILNMTWKEQSQSTGQSLAIAMIEMCHTKSMLLRLGKRARIIRRLRHEKIEDLEQFEYPDIGEIQAVKRYHDWRLSNINSIAVQLEETYHEQKQSCKIEKQNIKRNSTKCIIRM